MRKFRKLIYIQVHKGYFVHKVFNGSESNKLLCSGLTHPRTLAGDWKEIESGLRNIIIIHTGVLRYVLKPLLLIHLVPKYEGGYSTSEVRLFQELGVSAGADFCYMCLDKYPPLSDHDLKNFESLT